MVQATAFKEDKEAQKREIENRLAFVPKVVKESMTANQKEVSLLVAANITDMLNNPKLVLPKDTEFRVLLG